MLPQPQYANQDVASHAGTPAAYIQSSCTQQSTSHKQTTRDESCRVDASTSHAEH
jgi:hypothetical protein